LWMLPAHGTASRVSRLALAAYIVLYPAFDTLVGINSSLLIQYRQSLPPAEQSVIDPAIKALFFDRWPVVAQLAWAASIAWCVGALAAAMAVWRDWGWQVATPLALAGVFMTLDHAPPFGTLAGILLGVAVWQYLARERRRLEHVTTRMAAARV